MVPLEARKIKHPQIRFFYVMRIVPKEVRMTYVFTFMYPLIFIILTHLDIRYFINGVNYNYFFQVSSWCHINFPV